MKGLAKVYVVIWSASKIFHNHMIPLFGLSITAVFTAHSFA